MPITQNFIETVKARWAQSRRWTGRPGYFGFATLGVGTFICGMRHDSGMGLLLVIAIVAFVGEYMRLIRQKGGGL